MYCRCPDKRPVPMSIMGKSFEVCAKSKGGCGKEISGVDHPAGEVIPTGVECLDGLLMGGLKRGAMSCLIHGSVMSGQDLALSAAAQALEDGLKVGVFYANKSERSRGEMVLESMLSKVEYRSISAASIGLSSLSTSEQNMIKNARDAHWQRVFFKDYSDFTYLAKDCRDFSAKEGLDLVVIMALNVAMPLTVRELEGISQVAKDLGLHAMVQKKCFPMEEMASGNVSLLPERRFYDCMDQVIKFESARSHVAVRKGMVSVPTEGNWNKCKGSEVAWRHSTLRFY